MTCITPIYFIVYYHLLMLLLNIVITTFLEIVPIIDYKKYTLPSFNSFLQVDAPWHWQDVHVLMEHLQTLYRHYWHYRHLYIQLFFLVEGSSRLYSQTYQHLHNLLHFLLPHAIYTIDFHYREQPCYQYYKIVTFQTALHTYLFLF